MSSGPFFFRILMLLLTKSLASSDSLCYCSTTPCPVLGINTILIGNNTTATYVYIQNVDSFPVISSAFVTLTAADLDLGGVTSACTSAYARAMEDDGLSNVDAGHILAHRLGGPGADATNIFPQVMHTNRGSFAQFEGNIYDCLSPSSSDDPADSVALAWKFKYNDTASTQPHMVTYTSKYSGGSCVGSEVEFANTHYDEPQKLVKSLWGREDQHVR